VTGTSKLFDGIGHICYITLFRRSPNCRKRARASSSVEPYYVLESAVVEGDINVLGGLFNETRMELRRRQQPRFEKSKIEDVGEGQIAEYLPVLGDAVTYRG